MAHVQTFDELWSLFGSAEALPQASQSPLRLSGILDDPDPSLAEIETVVLADPGLTLAIIKAASSAMYARSRPVTFVREAVTVLGYRSLRSIAVALWTSSLVTNSNHETCFNATRFAEDGALVGMMAARLHTPTEDWATEEVYAVGLLHDLSTGLLSLLAPETYNTLYRLAEQKTAALPTVFQALYGKSISTLGNRAASTVGLPDKFLRPFAESAEEESAEAHVGELVRWLADYSDFKGCGVAPWVPHETASVDKLAERFGAETDLEALFAECRGSAVSKVA